VPYREAKFTYPPQYIVASKTDDERSGVYASSQEDIDFKEISSKTVNKIDFKIWMLKCRPNTIWSLPTGAVNLAMPKVPREHNFSEENTSVTFEQATTIKEYANEICKDSRAEEKEKWEKLAEDKYEDDHCTANSSQEVKGYGYEKTQKKERFGGYD